MSSVRAAGCALSIVTLLAAFSIEPSRAGNDTCVGADITSPIALPDGSEHAAGKLTLCLTQEYTPVVFFHEVSVNDIPVALLRSRPGISEGPAEDFPYMMFYRRPDGKLELFGYAVPGGEHMNTFWLERPPSRRGDTRVARLHTAELVQVPVLSR